MMIFTTSILALPFLLAVSVSDAYLCIATARVLCSKIPSLQDRAFFQGLKLLADGLPLRVNAWLARRIGRPVRSWVPWAVAISGVFFLRYILIGIVLAMF